jgi:tetratricopeptide (TPR) repeat protein
MASEAPSYRYSAYISYNHADKAIAGWLHRQLESYRIPKRLQERDSPIGLLGPKLPPIFRDREELASSADLAKSVRDALDQSATLIVICSPDGAQSRWVNEEVRTFRALGRAAHIQCLIVGGEPHARRNASLDPLLECFPPALFEDVDFEPLAADLRAGMDGKQAAKLKLLAGMMGVGYDELRQRDAERRQRRLAAIATASFAGLLLTSALAVFALWQRSEAITQRDIARQKTMTAERTVDFVKSLFVVSDPSEAKGATITAREILDRGARQIDASLDNEPEVKAELSTTLGEVYGGLGLFGQSDAILRRSMAIKGLPKLIKAQQLTALGDSQRRMGAYRESIASYKQALAITSSPSADLNRFQPRILTGLTQSLGFAGDYSNANKTANEALRQINIQSGYTDEDTAEVYEAIGFSALLDGRLQPAKTSFQRALALRRATPDDLHPQVTEDLNQLGDISYLLNDAPAAEKYYRKVLRNDRIVFGNNHPETALTTNNLGRMLLEQRKFDESGPIFENAISVKLKQFDATNANMIFPFANLAIVKHGLGDPRAAEPLFRKALTAARLHKHRNLAPILTDLAAALCDMGRTSEAAPLLAEAYPLMVKTYPKDPWRPAWTDFVRGRCLINSGDRAGGLALIRASAPALQKRWKPDSLYGHQVARQLAARR